MQAVNPQLIFLESALRPESVMQFFGYAQLACLLAYCWCRWKHPHELLAIIAAAGALFFAYSCLLLKPSWLFAFVATIAPIFVGVLGKGLPLRARLAGPALGVTPLWNLPLAPAGVVVHQRQTGQNLSPLHAFHHPCPDDRKETHRRRGGYA